MTFNYVEPKKFEVSDGLHTVLIQKADVKRSKQSGNEMLEITLYVPSSNHVPFIHYIVENGKTDDNGVRLFDKSLSRFYDAFGIDRYANPADFYTRESWKGLKAFAEFVSEPDAYTDRYGTTVQTTKKRIKRFEPYAVNGQQAQTPQSQNQPFQSQNQQFQPQNQQQQFRQQNQQQQWQGTQQTQMARQTPYGQSTTGGSDFPNYPPF